MSTPAAPAASPGDLEAPFLETEPPHWAARGLAYFLILLFVVAAVAAIFVRLPETVSSPFLLVPVRGTDAVKTLRSGVVVEAKVSEGQAVARSTTIFVIRSQEVGDRFSELATLENQLKNGAESLTNARRKRDSERRTDEEEARRLSAHMANLQQMLALKKEQLSVAREQFARSKILADQGLQSWVEYSNYEMKVNQTAMDLQQMETDQRDTVSAIEKLRDESEARETEFQELQRSLNESEQKARIRIKALAEDPADTRGNNLFVPSPCDGTVLRLQARRPGAVVREGDVLCEVACSGEHLQAELTVPQAGLAQIRPGQPVKLLYTAFPYQRYGVQRGTVRWTSPAGVMVNDAPSFRVFVELQEDSVRVNGQPRALMAGMGGNARIVVGSRSVISYAFEPLRQLRENLSAPPRPATPGPSP